MISPERLKEMLEKLEIEQANYHKGYDLPTATGWTNYRKSNDVITAGDAFDLSLEEEISIRKELLRLRSQKARLMEDAERLAEAAMDTHDYRFCVDGEVNRAINAYATLMKEIESEDK